MAALSLVVGLTVSLFVFALGAAAIFAAVCCYYREAQAPSFLPSVRRKRNGGSSPESEKGGVASAGGSPPIPTAKVCSDDAGIGVRRYAWSEIRRLTEDFTSAVVGQGGFSTVYVAQLPSGAAASLAAVKVHRDRTDRLRLAFRQELDVLLRVGRHDHIVRLLGYCEVGDVEGAGDDEEERGGVKAAAGALVLEYVPNGTLHEAMHSQQQVMEWGTRMSVAYELASALEYLHECCDPQVVHCDVKPSNVLLDGAARCKLCDFGSAKTGFSSTIGPLLASGQQQQQNRQMALLSSASPLGHPPSTFPTPTHNDSAGFHGDYYYHRSNRRTRPVLGSPGYVDPHYLRTGVASKKCDVYSFGVVVLELITGTEAFCPNTERMLTAAVRPVLMQLADGETADAGAAIAGWSNRRNELVRDLVDRRLGFGEYDPAEAVTMAGLALGCIREQPSMRPSMTDVVTAMRNKVLSAEQHQIDRKPNSKRDGAVPYK